MELVQYFAGTRVTIHVMDCGSKHDVQPILDELEASGNRDYKQMLALWERTAEHGVIWNDFKTKRLTKHINEFKARGGLRVLWFFDEPGNSIIICTHAFVKKQQETPRGEIDRAEERRVLYLKAR
ncbi:MAG: type II toxin-antitoxin system RelE/ParE family toxin [Verrucomicrobiaceae bacterium]|nr:type II toxin-antitoxin system RelE/ParE family toxin [Verrucomicrobiaceae bacterium]